MSNPFIFGGLANMGNAFLKSYQAETDRLDRKAAEAEESNWRNEQRERQRRDWQDKDRERQILEESYKPLGIEKSEITGEDGQVTTEFVVGDQRFADESAAQEALKKANTQAGMAKRASERLMPINPTLGLGMRKAAAESVKADNLFDEETQKQVRNTFNNQLIEMIPATGNWAESAVSSMDSLAGRKVARYEISDDKRFVSIYGPGDKGQEVKVGTFSNDAAGRLDFLDMAMKRPPEDMIKLLDARRLLLENERKKREEQAAKEEAWQERQLFAASLRDGGGGSSGGSSGRSGGGSSSGEVTPNTPYAIAAETEKQIRASIKETADAYKMPPDAQATVMNMGYNLASRNQGISPTMAAETAFMIATKPESVKPYFDRNSGSVVLGFQHPRNGSRLVVDDVDESILGQKDREEIARSVKTEVVDYYESNAPGLAPLIKQSAYENGGRPSAELKNAVVQAHMQLIEQQRRSQNQPPMSAIQLNSEATKRADAQLQLMASHIRAVARYLPQEKKRQPPAPSGQAAGDASQSDRGIMTDRRGNINLLEPFDRLGQWRRRISAESAQEQDALNNQMGLGLYDRR